MASSLLKSKCDELLKYLPDLQCRKCKNIPGPDGDQRNRYYCINESHSLCEEHKAECPCGSKVGKRPSPIVAKLLEDLPWMCRNYEKGCREINMNVEDLEHHQRKCIFRQVFCLWLLCKEKAMFKDVIEHYETLHQKLKEPKIVNEETNKWTIKVTAKGVDLNNYTDYSWYPWKVTTSYGNDFIMVAYLVRKIFHFWPYFFGSVDEVTKFDCLCSFKSQTGVEFTYRGPVHTLDKGKDDIIASGSFFAIPINAVNFSLDEEKGNEVEVTIRNLKEEAKDSDTSSGVSDDE